MNFRYYLNHISVPTLSEIQLGTQLLRGLLLVLDSGRKPALKKGGLQGGVSVPFVRHRPTYLVTIGQTISHHLLYLYLFFKNRVWVPDKEFLKETEDMRTRCGLNSCTPWHHPVCCGLLSCGCGKILWQGELKEEVRILAHSSRAQSIMVGKERSFKQPLASQPQSGSRKAMNALLSSLSIIDSPGSLSMFQWVFPH